MSTQDQSPKITFAPGAPILKVALMTDGTITTDGVACDLESLRALIHSTAQQKGMIWYYREASQTKAPPQSIEIMKAIIENRVPVRLSLQPDYSDSVGMDGKPIDRDGKPK
jgi:hypothetical protein